MDSKQIDTAMRDCLPVVCDGQRYRRILEYISWYDARVLAEKVELWEGDENQWAQNPAT